MSTRRVLLLAHRWIGLAIAAVVIVVIATGGVLIWPGPFPFRGVANRLHTRLALGPVGHGVVIASTVASIVVLIAGLLLWWDRKIVAVRWTAGWRRAVFDLHHSVGVFGFAFMCLLATTAMAMLGPPGGAVKTMLVDLHTTRRYGVAIKLLYTAGTVVFLFQVLLGIVMWWRPSSRK